MRLGDVHKTLAEFQRDIVGGAVHPRTGVYMAEKVTQSHSGTFSRKLYVYIFMSKYGFTYPILKFIHFCCICHLSVLKIISLFHAFCNWQFSEQHIRSLPEELHLA